ncbi:hypothetical protein [Glycomyces sp. NPDC048151]|uniref:hypothetical protein n=1 Tax=Glycomyces sp. NPDC048151 TaxID=3364002 RepID=UPI0037118D1F
MTEHPRDSETIMISERALTFAVIPVQARVRITDHHDAAIGSVIRLDSDHPALCISAPIEADWAGVHCTLLIAEAARIWNATVRNCDN